MHKSLRERGCCAGFILFCPRRIVGIGSVIACLALSAFTFPARGNRKCVPVHDPALLQERKETLHKTGMELLKAIRAGDPERFLVLVHEQFFGVGEGKSYTISEVKESFSAKEGIYCHLFNTECIPPLDVRARARVLSISEVARRPKARVRRAEVVTDAGDYTGCGGYIIFSWPQIPGEHLSVPVTRFAFVYEDSQWKTTGFDEEIISELE